ncbi:uncharacterized protein LOC125423859 [Ziziphus jujuba]|uniref:Uncharacterized protein LOC125423859 n=1 Tax=Ziziphus jujuba TaxID=326968 RepID=A0ABM3IUA3_ZIZJJ|nr:uncharacterized protein LOC125423859 [Ziziphus jujuba]
MVVKGISISMDESSVAISRCKTHLHLQKKKKKQKDFTDSDMEAAAQQLIQLSDEDNNNNNNNSNSGRNYNKVDDNGYGDEEVDQRVAKENGNYVINSGEENSSSNNNIMEEIFGKEEVLVFPAANRKRRYRSLADIYMETKPVVYHLLCGTTAKKLRFRDEKKVQFI